MNILVAIPSKSRPYDILKRTMKWITNSKYDFKVFVEPEELRYYIQTIGIDKVVCLDANNQGLGYAEKFIVDYAKEHSYELIFRLDDDVSHITHVTKMTDAEAFDKLIDDSIPYFQSEPKLGCVGFASDFYQGYLLPKMRLLYEGGNMFIERNPLICASFLIRTEAFKPSPEITSVDIYMNLKLWESGYYGYSYSGCMLIHDLVENKGGLNINLKERLEWINRDYDTMKREFPFLNKQVLVLNDKTKGIKLVVEAAKHNINYIKFDISAYQNKSKL